ncbi:MAG: xanthine dehydrogenase family protein subunit M [Desulfobacteraceae bacterium]
MMKNFIGSRALPEFVYHAPDTVEEVTAQLESSDTPFRILAGCTDFIPALRTGRWELNEGTHVIDLKRIKALDYIEKQGDTLRIGSCTRLSGILESALIREHAPVLVEAVGRMASWQVRNTATIGGNICMSSPAADTAPPLLVMDAAVTLAGPSGRQEIRLEDFFKGPGRNVLEKNQVLTEISFPAPEENGTSAFLKIGNRTAVIISIASAAARLALNNGVCDNPKIAMGSVAPTPLRMERAESFLAGKPLEARVIEECADIVSEDISPITDLRASGEYRRDVARTLVKRAITKCKERHQ